MNTQFVSVYCIPIDDAFCFSVTKVYSKIDVKDHFFRSIFKYLIIQTFISRELSSSFMMHFIYLKSHLLSFSFIVIILLMMRILYIKYLTVRKYIL